jgi:hypothetical protein
MGAYEEELGKMMADAVAEIVGPDDPAPSDDVMQAAMAKAIERFKEKHGLTAAEFAEWFDSPPSGNNDLTN